MIYKLISDKTENNRRVKTFQSPQGTETKITPIYTMQDGSQWWGFVDLNRIPYIRTAYAKNIMNLFTMGLSLKDLLEWCKDEKALLKSEDPEKYEKLYSLILEKEKVARSVADPTKQHLSLCTIYVLAEDERVDYFNEAEAEAKMKLWMNEPQAVSFFLNWHSGHIQRYLDTLEKITKTVSRLEKVNGKEPRQSLNR